MLLNSVIIVLREALEAAVLVAVLLALSRGLHRSVRWLWIALPLSMVGLVWFASLLEFLTDALNGAGQEVANASLQLLIYCLVVGIVAAVSAPANRGRTAPTVLMALAVFLALVREGSEILIYVSGFVAAEALRAPVFVGSFIGAGIGLSIGILLFAALRSRGEVRGRQLALALLGLIGAGMVMQATLMLEQVDWIPAGEPLWDSSGLVSEQSLGGQLLYAVFSYEATPGVVQVAVYSVSLCIIVAAWCLPRVIGGRGRV